MFRAGIKALLRLQADLEVVGEAGNGQEAMEKIKGFCPDVVLMDIAMPGMDGLTATRLIKEHNPETKVLLLTQHENKEYIIPALKVGASGYVLKRAAADELVNAIKTVYSGRSFLDPEITDIVLEDYRQRVANPHQDAFETLTDREREILVLLAQGHSNREIAEVLHISPKTVDFHRTNLMKKLDLHNRVELTKYAVKKGLVFG
ncbi:regulator [Clostridiales bacterium PH28_bin88]|nr:regulator [Clostridiales bacterium PH28_bin88]